MMDFWKYGILICALITRLVDSQIISETFVSGNGSVSVLGLSEIHDQPAKVCFTGSSKDWSDTEARVVCKHLDYQNGTAVLLTEDNIAGEASTGVVVSDFNCNGDESSLEQCQHGFAFMTDSGCGASHYAGVRCYSTDCGGIFTSPSGNFSSPNYPNRYPSGSNCTYIINVPSTNKIRLEFNNANFEDNYDYLEYAEGIIPNKNASHYITGARTLEPFELMVNSMWFRFISDESVNYNGFSLQYEAYSAPPCGGNFTNATGTFTSPSFPDDYPSYSNCTYIINIPDAKHITIHFDSYSLERGGHDNLHYGKGVDPSIEKRLGTLTGYRFGGPGSLEIPGSSAWFIFESDASVNYKGFEIRWEILTDAPTMEITDVAVVNQDGDVSTQGYARLLGLSGDHWVDICYDQDSGSWGPAEATIVCKSVGFDVGVPTRLNNGLQNSWVLHNFQCSDGAVSINECTWDSSVHSSSGCGDTGYAGVICNNNPCGGTFNTPTGTLLSPNFPEEYPSLVNCTYHVFVPGATNLNFTFNTFRLGYFADEDALSFFAEDPDVGNQRRGRLTGFGRSNPLVFYTNSIWFRFTSDERSTYKGFNITWQASVHYCDYEFGTPRGNFSSPRYPSNYPNLAYCTYRINVQEASSLSFEVDRFNTRAEDFLYIGNDTIVSVHTAIDYYSGWDIPTSLTVEGGYFWFIFTSDIVGGAFGFNITWSALVGSDGPDGICGQTFTTSTGSISSPNFPDRYPHNLNCTFSINVPNANRIDILPTVFDLEPYLDVLYVSPTPDFKETETEEFTGSYTSEFMTFPGSSLWFRFETDSSVSYNGFYLTWFAIGASECHGNYTEPFGSLTSPGYPMPYPSFSYCIYIIHVEGASHITISFTYFDLEQIYDTLHFGVGTDPSIYKSIGFFSGYFPPSDFSLPTSTLWFILDTFGVTGETGRGFELHWDTRIDAPETILTDVALHGNEAFGYVTVDYVEALTINEWANICYEGNSRTWSDVEAGAVCNYLGYENGKAMSFNDPLFSGWILTNFTCPIDNPDFSSVLDCTYSKLIHYDYDSTDGCDSQNYAGVQCSNSPCGGTFTTPTGVILSPNYPDRYPSKSYCVFVIDVPGATGLNLTFNDFHVEYSHDSLQIFESSAPPINDRVAREMLAGDGHFPPMYFVTGSLWLHFSSDATTEHTGFNISWKASYSDQCQHTYFDTSGTFSSPHYPQNYPRLANCTYLFNMTNATQIRFDIIDFGTEWFTDFVFFGNYTNGTAHVVEMLSGPIYGIQTSVLVTGSVAWVRFTSDIRNNDLGFEISWHALSSNGTTNLCGETFTSNVGTISSPGYPGRYPPGIECTYVINIPNAHAIRLTFVEFDLEDRYDYLEYGIGTDVHSSESERVTGNLDSFTIEIMSSSLWGRFISDSSVSYTGFLMTWEAFNSTSCNRVYNQTSGIIRSPSFPGPYPLFSNCSFVINVEGASHITINFIDFEVDYRHDFLHYGIGTEPSADGALGWFTGYWLPSDFSLPTSSMWFLLESNGSGEENGFQISWDTTTDAPQREINDIRVNNGDCEYDCPEGYVTFSHVEVLHEHNWAHVCYEYEDHTWSDEEAKAVCMFMGFDNGTAVAYDESDENGWILTNFVCSPDADSIYACNYDTVKFDEDGCGTKRYAGVRCTNTPCGGNHISRTGNILSPEYPNRYPSESNCIYRINVPGATTLNITFNNFQTEPYFDVLRFYASDPANDREYQEISGSGITGSLLFQTGSLWITFTSDFYLGYEGFNISYNASFDTCFKVFTDVKGVMSSPGYPDYYPHLAHCIYMFNISSATGIRFTNMDFDTEYARDYLYFGNGSEIEGVSAQETLSGNYYYDVPSEVTINGNSVWALFVSDVNEKGIGFEFEWEAIMETSTCGQTFTSRAGQIDSPNYPNRYPSNIYCTYLIKVPHANRIKIEFRAFDLEHNFDNLTYGVYNNSAAVNDTHLLTGFILPDPIELMTDNIWFEFVTDETVAETGFSFFYIASVEHDCSQHFNTPTGTITSPNYPASYPGYANCTSILNIPDAAFIHVEFDTLELQYGSDLLYIGVSSPPSIDTADYRFTGYTTPEPLYFQHSQIWLMFVSDGKGQDAGFSLTWDTTAGNPDTEITDVRIEDQYNLPSHAGQVSVLGLTGNVWASICSYGDFGGLSIVEATLICNTRGLELGTAENEDNSGSSNSQWSIRGFHCQPDDTDLNQCEFSEVVNQGCDSLGYGGVRCFNNPCGGDFSDESGIIQSPNYPSRYPNLSNCTYTINVKDATRLVVEFSAFQLESDVDKLEYYSTHTDVNTGHVGMLSGQGRPAPIEVYTNSLMFRFRSDLSVAYQGFRLSYQAYYESCNMNFTSTSGTFSSPNFPANYPHMMNCSYVFRIPKADSIHFSVESFETEHGTDVLYYGFGGKVDLSPKFSFTGSHQKTFLDVPTDSFWFHFQSDLTISGKGFNIIWRADTGSTATTSSATISLTTKSSGQITKLPPKLSTRQPYIQKTTMEREVTNSVTVKKQTEDINSGNNAGQSSTNQSTGMVAGIVVAGIISIVIIVIAVYVIYARRNSMGGNIMFRSSSLRSSGGDSMTDHQNAAFDADEAPIIT